MSPGLYFSRISSFSSSLLALAGLACTNMSSKVVTLASGLVSLTEARHDGQVYGFDLLEEACEA